MNIKVSFTASAIMTLAVGFLYPTPKVVAQVQVSETTTASDFASDHESGVAGNFRLVYDCRLAYVNPADNRPHIEVVDGALDLATCSDNESRVGLTSECSDDPVTIRTLPDGRRLAFVFEAGFQSARMVRTANLVFVYPHGGLPGNMAALDSLMGLNDSLPTTLLWSPTDLCRFRVTRE